MNGRDIADRLDFARVLGGEAAAMARDYFGRIGEIQVSRKGLQDVLTEADGAIERHLRARIEAAFPGDDVLGEEEGGEARGRTWVVDPIDGTSNFARGLPHFCVSIAFVADGATQIGVIDDPIGGTQYWAHRGGGAFRDGKPIRAAGTDDPRLAMADIGYSRRRPTDDYVACVKRFLAAGYDVRQAGSAALALAQVADGRIDMFFECHLYAWDVLAGELLVREAGGVTSGFLGGAGALSQGGPMLASAANLWPSCVSLIGEHLLAR